MRTLPEYDVPDGIPRDAFRFTLRESFFIFLSGITILLDFGLDLKLALYYKHESENIKRVLPDETEAENYKHYYYLTLASMIVPSVIIAVWSFVGYIGDTKNDKWPKISVSRWIILAIIHLLQLAPIWRCVETLIFGHPLRKKATEEEGKYFHRSHYRLSTVKLLEAFLEGCSQLVLQTYILIHALCRPDGKRQIGKKEIIIICIKLGISLISVAISMMNYHGKKRWDDPGKRVLHGPGVILQFCWYLLTLLSRLVALVALRELDMMAFWVSVIIHWFVTIFWIQIDNYISDPEVQFKDKIFHNMAIGGLYVFNFVKSFGHSMRWRYVIYYSVVFSEGLAILLCFKFLGKCNNHQVLIALWSIFLGSFVLGIFSMVFYYRSHPSVVHNRIKGHKMYRSNIKSDDAEKNENESL